MSLDPLLDPGADFLEFDFVETMGIVQRNESAGTTQSFTGINGLARAGESNEQDFAGQETTTIHLHKDDLDDQGIVLSPRDIVVRESGLQFIVLLVDTNTLETRIRVVCKRVR